MEMKSDKREIDKIYKRRDRYEIPDWQREKVWDEAKRQLLLDSILRGWKLPKFYFVAPAIEGGSVEVVDGQQRLQAIFDFFSGELALSARSAKEFGAARYADLPLNLSDAFDDYTIEFDSITNATEEEKREFFQRLQGGLPLTSSEKLNAIKSNLRDFCRKATKHSFFVSKVGVGDKRYAHFDIVAKVAVIEIDGLDVGLRFDDIKAVFDAQAKFSPRSNVARRVTEAFDYLDRVFPATSSILGNRTIVQAIATLIARLLASGDIDGYEDRLRAFFEGFVSELSHQVELGPKATDDEYVAFQRTLNANVRAGARVRQRILLSKLLQFEPKLAATLGPGIVAESGVSGDSKERASAIADLVEKININYQSKTGKDLFKATNKTVKALQRLGTPVTDVEEYGKLVDDLYFVLWEGVGERLKGAEPSSFTDVNILRTHLRHDVDHGKNTKASRKRHASTFAKYAGGSAPETIDPEGFAVTQRNLLAAVESDLRALLGAAR